MNKLCRFYWDCGRQGSLEGTFVASEDDLQKAIGQKLYFGEVLGKHSEIYGKLEEKDITILTDDQDFIQKAIEYGLVPCGYNPFDYLPENEDED